MTVVNEMLELGTNMFMHDDNIVCKSIITVMGKMQMFEVMSGNKF
jgi:hypothetical protein